MTDSNTLIRLYYDTPEGVTDSGADVHLENLANVVPVIGDGFVVQSNGVRAYWIVIARYFFPGPSAHIAGLVLRAAQVTPAMNNIAL